MTNGINPAVNKEKVMIPKIICFLFGHKIREKAYTGETYQTANLLGMPFSVSLYKWSYLEKCPRCGKKL